MSNSSIYAFVCLIGSAVAFLTFLIWVFTPTSLLHAFGITHFPNKNLALIVPTYIVVLAVFTVWLYLSTNLWRTIKPEDKSTVIDGYTVPAPREFVRISEHEGIPDFGDIDPVYAAQCLYSLKSSKE